MTDMTTETECPECRHAWEAHDGDGCNVDSCWCSQRRQDDGR